MPISRVFHVSTPVLGQLSIEDTLYGRLGAWKVEARRSGSVEILDTGLCLSFQKAQTITVQILTTRVVRHSSKSVNCEGHSTWV